MINTASRMANKKASMRVPYLRVSLRRNRPRGLFRQIPYGAEIELAGGELGKRFHRIEIFALGNPKGRYVGFADLPVQVGLREHGVDVEGHQAFASHVVRSAGPDALGIAENL